MPFIRIVLGGPEPSIEQIAQLQRRTTDLMVVILGKRREVTVVAVEAMPAGRWSAGGQTAPGEVGSAQMEAFITAGTNTGEEKAAFVRAAHALLASALERAATPIYVLVHELPATDWGYDGETQAARRHFSSPG